MKEQKIRSRPKAKRRTAGAGLDLPVERSGREAEVSLRESEAHYRVPWTASPDGKTLDISKRWTELTGLSWKKTVEGGWTEAVHTEDVASAIAQWKHSVDTGELFDIEYRLRLADGSYRWVRDRAYPRLDKAGRITRWFGFVEDVHEHHITLAALHASEERFQLATGAVVGFLYDYDILANRSERFGGTQQALGFTADEIAQTSQDKEWWIARIHPDEVGRVMEDVQRYLEGDASRYTHEYRFLHKHGHYIHISDRGRIVRDAAGHPVRMLGGIMDVSEQKRLEQERERLVAELQWERSRLREIFDSARSFLAFTRGPDHILEYVNEAYYELARRRDLLGRAVFDVFPEGKATMKPIRDRVFRDGVPFEGKEIPLDWTAPDGTQHQRFVDVTLLPATGPDGTRSGIILHGVDVTQHVLARREIEWLLADTEGLSDQERKSRVAAEHATKARDEMLRVVSHELGGPLSVINIAVSGILESTSSAGPAVQENAAILKRAAEWMERLLGDLGDVASIEAGRLALAPSHETPGVLVAQAESMFEGAARSSGITLKGSVAADLPVILVDSARMLQALGNLVTNALKATKRGGSITILAATDAAGVRLTVKDTGTGIAAENLPHMFDRVWQQTHHTNSGLGLGLAIVRGIVEAHGGALQVESTPGEGTNFSFTVPAAT
jgi:PAS domain S-box-containing protein